MFRQVNASCPPSPRQNTGKESTIADLFIMVHERTATCKSQLEPIIESNGNTLGGGGVGEQAFGR